MKVLATETRVDALVTDNHRKSVRHYSVTLAETWAWAVKVWNTSGKFGQWDITGMLFNLTGFKVELQTAELLTVTKIRAYLIWRAFKFALRTLVKGKITEQGALEGTQSMAHETGLIMYKPGRLVKMKGVEPPWPQQMRQFIRYVMPMPHTEYSLDGNTVVPAKIKYPLGANEDKSIIFYQVFWGILTGAADMPLAVQRIDLSKELPYGPDSAYQSSVVIVEKEMRAKAFMNKMRTMLRQNIADFSDPIKFQRDPQYDMVAASFRQQLIKKTAEVTAAKAQLNALTTEFGELIQARDLKLHELDPGAPVKPVDIAQLKRQLHISYEAEDLIGPTPDSQVADALSSGLGDLAFTAEGEGFM